MIGDAVPPGLDIQPEHWQIVRAILQKHVPQYEVWAFGSRVKGTAKKYSDLDLAVISDVALSSNITTALAEDFSESDLPYKVDVVDWATTSETFRNIISKKMVLLKYNKAKAYQHVTFKSISFREAVDSGTLEIGDGYRAKNEELGGSGPIFLRSACLQDGGFILNDPEKFINSDLSKFGNKITRNGDVVITTKGNSTGRVGQIRAPQEGSVYSPHLSYWRSKDSDKIDQSFLFYWSQGEEFRTQLAGMSSSTDMAPYMSLRDQLRLIITLPHIEHQRAVGATLRSINDKIDLNRRTNETLEAMAWAIFKDWFVDFGPTRAKMEGRAPYLASEIWSLFPDRLDDEGKPRGWQYKKVDDFADRIAMGPFGSNIKVETFLESGVPIISGQHLRETIMQDKDFKFISPDHAKRLSNSRALRGDIIFTHAGNIGQVSIIPEMSEFKEYIISQRQFLLRCNINVVSKYFVLYFFKSNAGQHRLLANSSQVGVPSIARPSTNLRSIEVCLPQIEIMIAFEGQIAALHRAITFNRREIYSLCKLRDLLLPKLMSGEIRVREAEKLVESLA